MQGLPTNMHLSDLKYIIKQNLINNIRLSFSEPDPILSEKQYCVDSLRNSIVLNKKHLELDYVVMCVDVDRRGKKGKKPM